jgi:hypothetical protein
MLCLYSHPLTKEASITTHPLLVPQTEHEYWYPKPLFIPPTDHNFVHSTHPTKRKITTASQPPNTNTLNTCWWGYTFSSPSRKLGVLIPNGMKFTRIYLWGFYWWWVMDSWRIHVGSTFFGRKSISVLLPWWKFIYHHRTFIWSRINLGLFKKLTSYQFLRNMLTWTKKTTSPNKTARRPFLEASYWRSLLESRCRLHLILLLRAYDCFDGSLFSFYFIFCLDVCILIV